MKKLEKINKLEVFSSEVRQWISLFTKSDSAAMSGYGAERVAGLK